MGLRASSCAFCLQRGRRLLLSQDLQDLLDPWDLQALRVPQVSLFLCFMPSQCILSYTGLYGMPTAVLKPRQEPGAESWEDLSQPFLTISLAGLYHCRLVIVSL